MSTTPAGTVDIWYVRVLCPLTSCVDSVDGNTFLDDLATSVDRVVNSTVSFTAVCTVDVPLPCRTLVTASAGPVSVIVDGNGCGRVTVSTAVCCVFELLSSAWLSDLVCGVSECGAGGTAGLSGNNEFADCFVGISASTVVITSNASEYVEAAVGLWLAASIVPEAPL